MREHRVGDEVRIEFSLRGREWKSPQGDLKYFNSLDVWRIEPARDAARSRRGTAGGRSDDAPPPPLDDPRPSDSDDLPF